MEVRWYVAKYMPDLRRREPHNVGVVLHVGDEMVSRFVAERPNDEVIDGRRKPGYIQSLDNYKAWVDSWRRTLADPGSVDESSLRVDPDSNYFIELGGRQIAGPEPDPQELLDELYATLVEELPEEESLSIASLAEAAIARLELDVERNVDLTFKDETGVPDHIRFDYRYENGSTNLMQRVALTYPDERSWKMLHAATWAFGQAHKHLGRAVMQIALIKTRERDDEVESQLELLERYARLIDVAKPDQAEEQLREVLSL